ncbi:MAG: HAMP domain-containing histidine kinase [Nitrospinota bacterium]|nr:HAMP domain-containing histidine kinase [Nitrospinota bacterium]
MPGDDSLPGATPVDSVRAILSDMSGHQTESDLKNLQATAREAILQVKIPAIPPMRPALEQICEVSRLLMSGATSSLVIRQGADWEVAAAGGEGSEKIHGMRVDPVGKSVAGYVINTRKPYFFFSISSLPELADNESRSRKFGDSFCSIPISDFSGSLLGVLNIAGIASDGASLASRQESIKGILDAIATKLAVIMEKETLFPIGDDIESLKRTAADKEKLLMMSVHDLKNSLTLIKANLFYLEQMKLGDEADEILGLIKFGGDRSLDLVLSILDSRMMRDHKLQPHFTTVDLRQLFSCLEKEFSIYAARMDVQIQLDLPVQSSTWADRTLLRRMVANLLDNALKHSPKDGKVVLSTIAGPDFIDIFVEDEGRGVGEQDREKIFGIFHSADDEGSAVPAYGIGLAFCKLGAWLHGGSIWVEPGSGNGARFVIRLPNN